MSRHTRMLALAAATMLTAWGMSSAPVSADPRHGHGHAWGHAHAPGQHKQKDDNGKHKGQHKTHDNRGKHLGHPKGPQGPQAPGAGSGGDDSIAGAHSGADIGAATGADTRADTRAETGTDGSPPGNNGTVKITNLADLDTIPDNLPHPGCVFAVEWYGFDEGAGIVSRVSFAMRSPTPAAGLSVRGDLSVPVGGDPAGGATDLDGLRFYALSFDGAPHPRQGFHVKVTVTTPRSYGSTTKTKVFWVEPCATRQPPGGTSGGKLPPGQHGQGVTHPSGTAASVSPHEVGGTLAAAPGETTPVAAEVPRSVEAGQGGILDWLRSPLGLILLSLGAALGVLAVAARRRAADPKS